MCDSTVVGAWSIAGMLWQHVEYMSSIKVNSIMFNYSLITGGPGQLPHLAPTFAAILALSSLGRESAYRVIDRYGTEILLHGQC